MGAERRRSDRYEQALPVDIHDRRGTRRATTVDVGRHGIFVEMEEPPPDRMLLRLTVHLADGPIPVLAAVVRRSEDAPLKGVGLQFFAIDEVAKDRWDRHIAGLRGGDRKLPAEQRTHVRHAATFLVRVRELDRLKELHTRDVSSGGFFLVSPVLRHVGSEVNLVFVHPGTREEFSVRGAVTRVQTQGIPGMGIRLFHFTDEGRESFRTFLESGLGATASQNFLEPPDGEVTEEIAVQPGDIESIELDPLDLGVPGERGDDEPAEEQGDAPAEPAAATAPQDASEAVPPAPAAAPDADATPPVAQAVRPADAPAPPEAATPEEAAPPAASEPAGPSVEAAAPPTEAGPAHAEAAPPAAAEPVAPTADAIPPPAADPPLPTVPPEVLASRDRAWREAEAEREIQAARAAEEEARQAAAEFGLAPEAPPQPAPRRPSPKLDFASQEPWPLAADDPSAGPAVTAPGAAGPEEAPAPAAPAPAPEAMPPAGKVPAAAGSGASIAPRAPGPAASPPASTRTPGPASAAPASTRTPGPASAAPASTRTPGPASATPASARRPDPQPARRSEPAPPDNRTPGPAASARAGDLTSLAALIAAQPEAIDLRLRLAAQLVAAGRAREAFDQAAAAVRLDPRHPIALGSLARVLVAMGRPDDAEAALRRARKAGFLGDEPIAAEIARLRGR